MSFVVDGVAGLVVGAETFPLASPGRRKVPYLLVSVSMVGTESLAECWLSFPDECRSEVDEVEGTSSSRIGVYTTRGESSEKRSGNSIRTRKVGKIR